MTQKPRFFALIGMALAVFCAGLQAQNRPQVTQQLDGFLRPTAAVFSPDQRYLFVINHSQGEAGTLRSESFLSKLSVDASGQVSVDSMRFVTSLTAPIDMDFSPVRYGNVPQGALFMVVGSPLVQDSAGRALKDLSRIMIGLLVIDPNRGRVIKKIDLSPNSKVTLDGKQSLLAPSSLCFDTKGNLYIGESGVGGHMFDRRQPGRPGIWRIDSESVQELLSDGVPKKVEFIRTTSLPSDMIYRESEDMLYFITNHTQGRPSGSVFRIEAGKYEGIESMQTIVRGITALSGIQITPTNRVLLVGNSGELMFPKGKKDTRSIRFRPQRDFSTPGKFALAPMKDGSILLAVPEQSSDAGLGKGQRVSIVTLPSGY
ncbi:hypothetical protein [Pelagicoccus sp. SDUM812003]|uniref:hypothetical protein n=1 Tax=Pelagicoccus sp. SDUM812003 TaxID=3041267 RepID=UPI00280F859C|nr:hypothetical protein [Pelagicoccus sp. SDUM812003]MDQ8203194.1 hypothetical protein [Pelagicoccus sp. SDUM812003]